MRGLSEQQYLLIKFWLPAVVCGALAWVAFLLLGDTPIVRASGLALVIMGIVLTLRRMGAVLAGIGGLTLAFCPAFWVQTGGGEGEPATIVIALLSAIVVMVLAVMVSKRPYIGFGLGVVIFVILFWSQIGTPRSIRLTAFVVSWLLYLVMDMLLITNPRPDDAPPLLLNQTDHHKQALQAQPYHTWGILLLFGVGILNDSLVTLLAPAIFLSLYLSRTPLPVIFWVSLSLIVGVGMRGIVTDYGVVQAQFVMLGAWRDGRQWVELVNFVIAQFSILGVMAGVLGLARLARWYPPIGIVTMLCYAAYTGFALVYSGPNIESLLLPLLIVHTVWITYAVFALGEWAKKSFLVMGRWIRRAIILLYGLLPLIFLLNNLDAL